ncbi:hypothetical protein B7494_g2565 [Chlorociboria aeruginascens]|nr:hypothetical protein B7494_g2565 [Chlorociboria aeruginascens]
MSAPKSQDHDGKDAVLVLERLKASHPAIADIMSVSGTVGTSVGVIYHGEVIHTGHFGFRDRSQKLAPNDDTIYPICSLSKSITAATIGVLVEDGQFSYETKIRDILPEFKVRDDDLRENGTLTDILSHRSGLQGSNMWLGSQNNVLFPAKDAMTVINSLKLAHPFRSAWEYSNYGYELAAQMIKRATGSPWQDVITERVLKPLHLERTGFDSEFGNHENVALAYATLDDASPVLIEGPKLSAQTILGAGGGVRSSIKDMLEIYRVLLLSGSDQLRTGKSSTPDSPFQNVQKQFASHINLSGAKYSETGYGFGLARVQLPGPMGAIGTNPALMPDMPVVARGSPPQLALYHQGTLAGAFATVVLFPESDSGIVVLSNSLPLNDSDDWIKYARKSAASQRGWHDRLTTELRQNFRPGTTPKTLKIYAGKYYNAARTLLIHITAEGGKLVMNFQDNPQENYSLEHYHDDTFTWLPSRNDLARRGRFTRFGAWFYTLRFIENSNGDIASLNWAHDEARKEGDDFFKE